MVEQLSQLEMVAAEDTVGAGFDAGASVFLAALSLLLELLHPAIDQSTSARRKNDPERMQDNTTGMENLF